MTRLDHIQGLIGLALVGIGAWFVYPPAAVLLIGAILLADARFGATK